jgi:hypothetical protein
MRREGAVPRSYRIVTSDDAGRERTREYTSEETLAPGAVISLGGRYWLVGRVEQNRVQAHPARYRLTLRHPDGREELGAFRRFHADAPRIGHQLTTVEDGTTISWAVVEQRLVYDDTGTPFLELIAERDHGEAESLPDHQLEHALERDDDDAAGAAAALARAEAGGLAAELVALEAGQAPDWDEAARYLDSLILEEIHDGLLELCGVDPGRDPQETWLETVKARLRDDLESFRADIERNHDQMDEWDFRGGRTFAAVGKADDESNPLSGYGWMSRLWDAGVLGAAGFQRVRKADL